MLSRFLVTLALMALGLTAALSQELKIGAIGTLSGGGTQWGIATQRGVQLALDEVNARGGITVGNKAYQSTLVMYDDQYTGQGGTTAATRLVDADKVKFIIGPIGSPAVLGALGVTGPAKVLVLSDGFSPRILTADSKYNFRITLTTREFAPALVKWVRDHNGSAKRVGVISPNDAVGQSVVPILLDAYKAQNFEVAVNDHYERGMSDFTPLITRMMASNIDVLELDSNAPGETGLLVRQARQLGFHGLIVQTGGPAVDEVIKVAGPLAEGFISYATFDSEDPGMVTFTKAYGAKYSGPIDPFAPLMYNGAKILFEAIRRAGTIETDAVGDQLTKLAGYETIFGSVRWGGKQVYGINHQLLLDFMIAQVKDGKQQMIGRVKTDVP